MAQLIKNWNELSQIPPNDKYYIEIDERRCCGWIRDVHDDNYYRYLSTHTFYGKTYISSTLALQECGFDVQIANCDGETEEVDYCKQWLYSGKCEFCRKQEYCTHSCKAKKEREKSHAVQWYFKAENATDNEFDIQQRREMDNITVAQLIDKLSQLSPDCKVNFSGSAVEYLHVSKDGSICSLDYDDLDDSYYEKGITK